MMYHQRDRLPVPNFVVFRNTNTDFSRVEQAKEWKDKTYNLLIAQPSGADLEIVSGLIEEGVLKIHIANIVPLARAK